MNLVDEILRFFDHTPNAILRGRVDATGTAEAGAALTHRLTVVGEGGSYNVDRYLHAATQESRGKGLVAGHLRRVASLAVSSRR